MPDTQTPSTEQAWYVEERHNDLWAPVLFHGDKPSPKRSLGPNRRFRGDPVKVEPEDVSLSLTELQAKYGPADPV